MKNSVVNLSEEYNRAKEKTKGLTAETAPVKNSLSSPVSATRKKSLAFITPAESVSSPGAQKDVSGKTGYSTLDEVTGGKKVLEYKNQYNAGNSPQFNLSLSQGADAIRKEYGLSDEKFGANVTSKDVVDHLRKLEGSPAYQRDLAYKTYGENNKQLSNSLSKELSNEVKMRAVLDRAQAEKMAEEQVGAQLDKEIEDSLNYEDELAAQRGSYHQMSYGKRRALKEESLRDNRAARILNLVNSILEEDRQKAENEFQADLTNKENRINALGQQMKQNDADFQLSQQYRSEVAQQAANEQKAIYDSIKAQYDQAFDMSNALGYVTPELASLTGISEGTPLFKLTEYYGNMQKFYDELELEAQRVAIEQYKATRPSYSYSGNNNSSGDGSLTWNQAKSIWEKFSTDFSNSNGDMKPTISDTLDFIKNTGFGPKDQEQIILAAGITPKNVESYVAAYQNPRDGEGRTVY